jgi:transcription elongation factor
VAKFIPLDFVNIKDLITNEYVSRYKLKCNSLDLLLFVFSIKKKQRSFEMGQFIGP